MNKRPVFMITGTGVSAVKKFANSGYTNNQDLLGLLM
tara:strand:- start:5161 stop:5271 length:111 start_codon:yes stop_codon:yes gene_type:complete